jgi:anti-sigma B factor antagonist
MYDSEIRIDLSAAGITVLELLGDHDLATADDLSAAIDQALASRPGLIVDLTETTFIDSTVVHLLINAHQVLEARGHQLTVQITEASTALRVLELTQLDNALGLARDRDEAIASANGRPDLVSHLPAPPSPATPHERELAVEHSADPALG